MTAAKKRACVWTFGWCPKQKPNQPHRWPDHGARAPPPHPTPESEMSTRTSSPVLVSGLVFHSHGAVAISSLTLRPQLPSPLLLALPLWLGRQPGRWRLGAAHGRCPPHRPATAPPSSNCLDRSPRPISANNPARSKLELEYSLKKNWN